MSKARLVACPGCARHVRVSESNCVFCEVALPASFREGPVLPPPPRLSRGGLYSYRARALAASAAALVTASCGGALDSSSSLPGSEAGASDAQVTYDSSYGGPHWEPEAGRAMPAYGGTSPIELIDASTDRVEPVDAPVPIDVGQADAGYGVPWPVDAETLDVNPGGGSLGDGSGIELGGASYGGPTP